MKRASAQLVANRDYLPELIALIGRAKTSIDIVAFSFAVGSSRGVLAPGSAPYQIAQALIDRKKILKSKITIRLYIEGHRETTDRNEVTASLLKKAKIKVKFGSTHAKGFMIDNKWVLFGSTNLTQQSITKNNETNLLLRSAPVAKGFARYFEHLWRGGRHGGVTLPLPLLADGDFKPALLSAIAEAKTKLEFSIYFFSQPDIEAAFVQAHARGVKIYGFVHQHFFFDMSYVRRTRATVERLRRAGIKNLLFGPPGLFTHSKYLVADGAKILLGTGNWLDEDIETHPQLYISLTDKGLARAMGRVLAGQLKTAAIAKAADTEFYRERSRLSSKALNPKSAKPKKK